MVYQSPLKEMGHRDAGPAGGIEDSHRGVSFDYCYTGKRQGTENIELYVTSTVRDWQDQVYIRKSFYMGHKNTWKECIGKHISNHLLDLGVDSLMVKRMLREVEIGPAGFVSWERYRW